MGRILTLQLFFCFMVSMPLSGQLCQEFTGGSSLPVSPADICVPDAIVISESGLNIPSTSQVVWVIGNTDNFDPGTGVYLGSSNVTSAFPDNCDIDPTVLAILVNPCGSTDQLDELAVLHSGSGFSINSLTIDFDANNNSGGATGDDINLGQSCNWTLGDPNLISGCDNVIAVGPGDDVPANAIIIVQTSNSGVEVIDFSSLCSATDECIYVVKNDCARNFAGFTNVSSSLRTYIFGFCGVTESIAYIGDNNTDTQGDFLLHDNGTITFGNNGCAGPDPSFTSLPDYVSTIDPFTYETNFYDCDSGPLFIVGVVDPEPEGCCNLVTTNYYEFQAHCPFADPSYSGPVCEGGDLEFYDVNVGGIGFQWDWEGPNVTFSGLPFVMNNVSLADAGTYTLTVTDDNMCTDEMSFEVVITAAPSVTMTTLDPDICYGECTSVDFNVSGGSGGPYEVTYEITAGITIPVTFTLSGPTGSFMVCTTSDFFPSYDSTNDIAYIPESISSLTIVLTGIEEGTCDGTIDPTPIQISLIAPPDDPNIMDVSICENTSTTLSFSNCSGTSNWYADAAGSTLLFSGNTFVTPVLATTTSYWVACADGDCESNLIEVTIDILSPCDASCTTMQACDDNNPCTNNDMETVGSDGSDCIPCAGISNTTDEPLVVPQTICENQSTTLIATGCGGTVSWYESSAGTNLLATGTMFTTPLLTNSTSYLVSCTENNCESPLIETSVNIIRIDAMITVLPTCNSEGTDGNALDDTYTFEITVTGDNVSSSWTSDDPSSTSGMYNVSTEFGPFLISDGSFVLNIIDDQSTACATALTINPPPPCSDACMLLDAGLDEVLCIDAGTVSNASDDFITFTLDPTGNNLGGSYTVTVNSGSVFPITANYGAPTNFSLQGGSAGSGDIMLTITDDNDPACNLTITITDPDSCSPDCTLDGAGLQLVVCNQNNTASNDTDDIITFNLYPTGQNIGSNYNVSVDQGTIAPGVASYGALPNFSLQNGSAGGGNVELTITDGDDPDCSITITIVDPGTCSGDCSILTNGLDLVVCNNGGTSSDDTDDFISFVLNPSGDNLSNDYTVSVDIGSISPTGANYGSPSSFTLQGGSAGGGDITLTITDDSDAACAISFTIVDPEACSPDCALQDEGLTLLTCNGNGTASDEADDFITFSLDPSGLNLGSDYNVSVNTGSITPISSSYGALTNFNLQNGSAGGGDVELTITDVDDPACSITITIIDPGACSDECAIGDAGLNLVACNNGGTSSEIGDDFITFILNPTGDNLSTSYTVSVNTGSILPNNSNYGSPTNFSLQGGSAGGGNVELTITDDNNPACSITMTIIDPGSCSSDCSLDNAGLGEVDCDNNSTGSDGTDDFITFNLDPSGLNLGSDYNVSVNTGSVTPTSSSYGALTNFNLQNGSASGGNVELTITDVDDPSCSITITIIDPGACSDECAIGDAGLNLVACNNGGTSSELGDDFITFILNPTGDNLSTSYTVSVNTGSILPNNSNYGSPTNFSLQGGSAGGGNVELTITDDNNPACNITITIIDPGSCSSDCSLDNAGLGQIDCDNNSTGSDGTDDFMTFNLDPSGLNLGSDYNVSVNSGSITPISSSYGALTNFNLQNGSAGGGDVELTITDVDDPACSITITIVDPNSCSDDCFLMDSGLDLIQCFDGGTSTDEDDDSINFILNPTGQNLGGFYNLTVNQGAVLPPNATYGGPSTFTFTVGSAGEGDVELTITDSNNPACSITVTVVDPGTCSTGCAINEIGLFDIACFDNSTSANNTDDIITFSMDPVGSNVGVLYTVTVSSGTVTPTSSTFGMPTSFSMQGGSAGGGDFVITVTSVDEPSCFETVTLTDPLSCSGDCEISDIGLSNLTCNTNGTLGDDLDDFISFDIDPIGFNLSDNYNITVSSGTISPTLGDYGMITSFMLQVGSAGAGDISITIESVDTPGCDFTITLSDPGPCSSNCNITTSGLSNIFCGDNGSGADVGDDFINFSLNPTGNDLSASYTVSSSTGVVSPLLANFGSSENFVLNGGSAGGGDVLITITDSADPSCTISFIVEDPGECSSQCQLDEAGLVSVICQDNNTPSDNTDDYISFILNPTGGNLSQTYDVIVNNGFISPTAAAYGSPQVFDLEIGSAGSGNVILIITDADDISCEIIIDIIDPGACSENCDLSLLNLGNVSCNSNNTGGDPTDDFISFDLDPQGENLGLSYTVTTSGALLTPSSGIFGQLTNFQLEAGSAGNGAVTITITSDDDPGCFLTGIIDDPDNCSSSCELILAGLSNQSCNNNGTLTDDTDDYIQFELNPTGFNLSSNYSITSSSGTITPDISVYGINTLFTFQPGSAGAGDVILTITDSGNLSCSLMMTIIDNGPCSSSCNIVNFNLQIIDCDDNDTPSDDSDDVITLEISPEGSNLASSYNISVNQGTVQPTTGTYGMPIILSLGNSSAGNGDVIITVTDATDPSCFLSAIVTDPGSCSDECIIENIGLNNLSCNSNGTTTDDTDDFIGFTINPSGNNLGTSYTVSVSSGTIDVTTGLYGAPLSISMQDGSAGSGDVVLTVTDVNNPDCSITITLEDPGACSTSCNIEASNVTDVICNNNNTLSDSSDDFISFSLQPQGTNVSTEYIVTTNNGAITPTSGTYGMLTLFELELGSAGSGDIVITITDMSDPSCFISNIIADPGSCSDECEILDIGLSEVMCNPHITPTDNSDDYIIFSLDPSGFNLSNNYDISVNQGGVLPMNGIYGSPSTFTLNLGSAGSGNVFLTLTDGDNPDCSIVVEIEDPGACSTDCVFGMVNPSGLDCDAGLLLDDPSDDFIVFNLNIQATNVGANYAVSVAQGSISPTQGTYDNVEFFMLQAGSAGGGDIELTITDIDDPNCTFTIVVPDTGPCDSACVLIADGQTTFACIADPTVELMVDASQGTVPYTYEWPDNITGNPVVIALPGSGTFEYAVTVTDALDCVVETTVTLEVSEFNVREITSVLCTDEDIIVNGVVYNVDNPVGEEIIEQAVSCDSLLRVDLSFYEESILVVDETYCEDAVVYFGGEEFDVDYPTGEVYLENASVNGCDSTIIVNLDFSNDNDPDFDIVILNGQDNNYTLSTSSEVILDSIEWGGSSQISCDLCPDVSFMISETTEITATGYYGENCIVFASINLVPVTIDTSKIYIPTIFSPNGDGVNDRFLLGSAEDIFISSFFVFDRWGNKVWGRKNMNTNDPDASWDGKYNGQALQPGVYIYVFKIINGDNSEELISGEITIIY